MPSYPVGRQVILHLRANRPTGKDHRHLSGKNDIDRRLGAAEKDISLLRSEIRRLRGEYDDVLRNKDFPADVVVVKARKTIEGICKCIYNREGLDGEGKPARKMMLEELLLAIGRRNIVPPAIMTHLSYIQSCGNLAGHDQGEHNERIREKEFSEPCLKALALVANWYFEEYCGDIEPETTTASKPPTIPDDDARRVSSPTAEPVTCQGPIPLSQAGQGAGPVGRPLDCPHP
jgi:hypothetical protein